MSVVADEWSAPRKAALVVEVLGGGDAAAIAARAGLRREQVEAWAATGLAALEQALRVPDGPDTARVRHGDLRDLIAHPHTQAATVTAAPEDPLHLALQRMRAHDVSQLPVVQEGRIVGLLDESDLLLHVYGDEARFDDPVAAAMVDRLDKLPHTAPIEALLPVFGRGHVAIVMEGEQFLGLVTRSDLLSHLRQRQP